MMIILIIVLEIVLAECPEGYQEYSEADIECYINSDNDCYSINDIVVLNTLLENNCIDFDQNGI